MTVNLKPKNSKRLESAFIKCLKSREESNEFYCDGSPVTQRDLSQFSKQDMIDPDICDDFVKNLDVTNSTKNRWEGLIDAAVA